MIKRQKRQSYKLLTRLTQQALSRKEVSEKPLKFGQRPLITQILERLHGFLSSSFNLWNLLFNLRNHKERLFQGSPKIYHYA